MDKPLVLTRGVLFLFFIFLALIPLSRCNPRVKGMEGKMVTLIFSYPCDSDKITIQRANGAPFYNSAEPGDLNLQDDTLNRFSVEEKNCSVQVEINPVMRDDEATYVGKTYKDGVIQGDFIRVRLSIDYPPGTVSCVPSDNEVHNFFGTWVKLQCEASVGSVDGEILCYQDAKRLPPDKDLGQIDDILKQSILVSKNYTVFCCSSVFDQPKDICECNDFAWDPSSTKRVLHPCPYTTPTQGTTIKNQHGENSRPKDHPFPSTVTPLTLKTIPNKVHLSPWVWEFVLTVVALLTCLVASLVLVTLCLWCKGRSNNTDSTEKKDGNPETSELISKQDCASPKSDKEFVLVDIQNKE